MNGRTNSSGTTINDLKIPLDPCINLIAVAGNGQVLLTWTDPKDKYATPEGEAMEDTDQLVSVWAYTRIVRKTGSAPASPNDGVLVVESSVRNQYQSTAYVDSGLTNDTTYYYGVFAYNKDGVASSGAFVNAMPRSYVPVLNDNSWALIKSVAAGGFASSVWSVGDCKQITLNGSAGDISLSNYSMCAFILGFNHNAALEGNNTIHFQLGKTALTRGTDICFYSEGMNTGYTNSGGWMNSYMRKSILGTSVSSYSGKFIGALPADLRIVLKAVQKYTNNSGESGGQSAVTATTDYMFLLGEPEVFGSTKYANDYEANYQEQYAYYASGNSKIKYRHDRTGSAVAWWERSPQMNSSDRFCAVSSHGGEDYYDASFGVGIAPAFAVG